MVFAFCGASEVLSVLKTFQNSFKEEYTSSTSTNEEVKSFPCKLTDYTISKLTWDKATRTTKHVNLKSHMPWWLFPWAFLGFCLQNNLCYYIQTTCPSLWAMHGYCSCSRCKALLPADITSTMIYFRKTFKWLDMVLGQSTFFQQCENSLSYI